MLHLLELVVRHHASQSRGNLGDWQERALETLLRRREQQLPSPGLTSKRHPKSV
jgi:hypothetical protein